MLVTGARLGDTRGYRRMFLTGLGGFTLASLACGLAPEEYTLILARIAQGTSAALMVPQVLSGIHVHFAGPARARAQAMLVLALSGGAVAGQVLGGVLVGADLFGLGWRPIFLMYGGLIWIVLSVPVRSGAVVSAQVSPRFRGVLAGGSSGALRSVRVGLSPSG